jgi:hypothetical protein
VVRILFAGQGSVSVLHKSCWRAVARVALGPIYPRRTLPGEKDPDHIARIQARNLPAPPLSYTQSAGVTGITTASGTYMSDDRPSMRHKD